MRANYFDHTAAKFQKLKSACLFWVITVVIIISITIILSSGHIEGGGQELGEFCGQSHTDRQWSPTVERGGAATATAAAAAAAVALSGAHSSNHLQAKQQQQEGKLRGPGRGVRQKRSTSQPPTKLNLWDQLEALFAAYRAQYDHFDSRQDTQNFRIETPTPHELDTLGGGGGNDDRMAADGSSPEAREPRLNQAPDGSQLFSSRQGGGGGGAAADDEQAAQMSSPTSKVIETAVFIDQALDNKFTGLSNGLVELNKLVLTIMNQVQYLLEYSSLQASIKLKLVLVEHLRESERLTGMPPPNPERGDIDAYLSNFCNWQQARLDSEKRLWWDHAILLSGLDLYKATPGKNHSGVLGLAWVGGMCKGNYSCTINEASNFESAFVIAHEIGHSLGIMHDGQKNKCDPNSFIMSERTGAGKVHWSKCSNSYLNESIQRGQLKCLDSEQNNQIDTLYDLTKLRAPGQVYSINEQCRLAFGSNYSSFMAQQAPFNAVCRELWCVSGTWAKAAHPALEGSSCNQHGLVCREGKCLRAPQ